MTRKPVTKKNENVSISLTSDQKKFLENNPNFNLSKFVQITLGDFIELESAYLQAERELKGGNKKQDDKI